MKVIIPIIKFNNLKLEKSVFYLDFSKLNLVKEDQYRNFMKQNSRLVPTVKKSSILKIIKSLKKNI